MRQLLYQVSSVLRVSLLGLALIGSGCTDDKHSNPLRPAMVTGTLTLPAAAQDKEWVVLIDDDLKGKLR